eukprot:1117-Heterococcus_DN1.PRE.12
MRVTSFLALFALALASIASAVADTGLIELHDAKPIVDYITPVEPKAMSPTVGGWTDQTSSKEPEKEEVVNWTLAQTKKLKNVGEGDKLTVQSVKTQVVAGLNYDIVTKQETADGKILHVSLREHLSLQQCYLHHMIVYVVPWKNERSITTDETTEC